MGRLFTAGNVNNATELAPTVRTGTEPDHDPQSCAPDEVLLHILDPNREVAPSYVAQLIVLKDGQQLAGLLADESASQLTVRMPNGRTETILRDQVEEVVSQNQSLMPSGLEQKISPGEMADLLQFLLK